jgi:hypothetical protein
VHCTVGSSLAGLTTTSNALLSSVSNRKLLLRSCVSLIALWWLSVRCWERQSHINSIWDRFWSLLSSGKSRVILLEPELVTDFGNDQLVNKALKEIIQKREQSGGEFINEGPNTHSMTS